MTSPATHEATVAFFAEHERFGLPEADLMIFRQGTMPAVDAQSGRVLLEDPGRIATSPDGHGGMVAALSGSGADGHRAPRHPTAVLFPGRQPLGRRLRARSLSAITSLPRSEFPARLSRKHDPLERLGIVGPDRRSADGDRIQRSAGGHRPGSATPTVRCGTGPAASPFTSSMPGSCGGMAAAADGLPFHLARKKVACLDAAGRRIEPAEPNAIKFERFIFDLMPRARRAIVVEVDRAQAFAPLKNASGAKA